MKSQGDDDGDDVRKGTVGRRRESEDEDINDNAHSLR